MYVRVYICVCVYICICVYVCVCICVYIYVSMCMCVCMYVCMYVCVYVYTFFIRKFSWASVHKFSIFTNNSESNSFSDILYLHFIFLLADMSRI